MKKIIKYITENIRPPLFILFILFITATAIGQVHQTGTTQPQTIICGSYPANGKMVEGVAETYAGGDGCVTIITKGSSDTVFFTSPVRVVLKPGFIAQDGSKFIAYIDSSSAKPPASYSITASNENNAATQSAIQKANSNEMVSVAPNPFSSTFIVSVNSARDVKALVIIYNSVGVKVKQQTGLNLIKGINKISLSCPGLAQGVYTLEVNFDNSKVVKKIVKS